MRLWDTGATPHQKFKQLVCTHSFPKSNLALSTALCAGAFLTHHHPYHPSSLAIHGYGSLHTKVLHQLVHGPWFQRRLQSSITPMFLSSPRTIFIYTALSDQVHFYFTFPLMFPVPHSSLHAALYHKHSTITHGLPQSTLIRSIAKMVLVI
jgi:hypothetical protein